MIFQRIGQIAEVTDSIHNNESFNTLAAKPLINVESPASVWDPEALAFVVQNVIILAPSTTSIDKLGASKVIHDCLDHGDAVNWLRAWVLDQNVGIWWDIRVGRGDYNCGGKCGVKKQNCHKEKIRLENKIHDCLSFLRISLFYNQENLFSGLSKLSLLSFAISLIDEIFFYFLIPAKPFTKRVFLMYNNWL